METVELLAKKSLVGKRLDLAMVDGVKGLSRRRAKTLIDSGEVYLNDRRIRISSRALAFGDKLVFRYSPEQKKKKTVITIDETSILYFDHGVLAINKPAGLSSQAARKGDNLHVVPLLQKYFQSKDIDLPNLSLVHRLDKETSGVLLLADNKALAESLMDQFRQKTVKKVYHALCYGKADDKFAVRCNLSSINPKNGMVKVVQKSGKDSETSFSLKEFFKLSRLSLVECKPITGRSHQLRVHLAKSRLGIVGDKVYGDQSLSLGDELSALVNHHLLHARTLSFTIPSTKKSLQVKAPYPKSWKSILEKLRELEA